MDDSKNPTVDGIARFIMNTIKIMVTLIIVLIIALIAYSYYQKKQSAEHATQAVYMSYDAHGNPIYSDKKTATSVTVSFDDVKANFLSFTGLGESDTTAQPLEPITTRDPIEYIRQENLRNQRIIQDAKNQRMENAINGQP